MRLKTVKFHVRTIDDSSKSGLGCIFWDFLGFFLRLAFVGIVRQANYNSRQWVYIDSTFTYTNKPYFKADYGSTYWFTLIL